ncbi:MAG: orotidine-5'-phosphate decarboxylase [Actinomycetota bacterium]
MEFGSPICLALDSRDRAEIAKLVKATEAHVGVFKVGLTSYIAFGSDLTVSLTERRPVFLDLKLHDIPAQVSGAVAAAAASGASLVTIHAAGGGDMVRAATDAAGDGVTILAVTVLTSLDERALATIGMSGSVEDSVLRLAELALAGGAGGLVCSPLEVAALRARFGRRDEGGPLLVVPGVRPEGSESGDQKRTLTARAARSAGADLLVVGRPITGAEDPASAAAAMAQEAGG